MLIRFVIDENLRGFIHRAAMRHNDRGVNPIDVVRVGDLDGPPLGTKDSQILMWAEQEQRILVSNDHRSLPGHLADHLAAGRHVPGIFTTRPVPENQIVEFLVAVVYASEPEEWQDRIVVIP